VSALAWAEALGERIGRHLALVVLRERRQRSQPPARRVVVPPPLPPEALAQRPPPRRLLAQIAELPPFLEDEEREQAELRRLLAGPDVLRFRSP
jgi:hypothetical protein